MRAAWSRWTRTKDATNESWDAAKDSARRCGGGGGWWLLSVQKAALQNAMRAAAAAAAPPPAAGVRLYQRCPKAMRCMT
jgi:hypothetical protein